MDCHFVHPQSFLRAPNAPIYTSLRIFSALTPLFVDDKPAPVLATNVAAIVEVLKTNCEQVGIVCSTIGGDPRIVGDTYGALPIRYGIRGFESVDPLPLGRSSEHGGFGSHFVGVGTIADFDKLETSRLSSRHLGAYITPTCGVVSKLFDHLHGFIRGSIEVKREFKYFSYPWICRRGIRCSGILCRHAIVLRFWCCLCGLRRHRCSFFSSRE